MLAGGTLPLVLSSSHFLSRLHLLPLKLTPPSITLNPHGARVSYPHLRKFSTPRARSSRGSQNQWEEPDDGDDTDLEEEEEEDEDEEEGDGSHTKPTAFVFEDVVTEVELLLGPEERTILQQNVIPDLGKISTMKWSPLHSLAISGQIPFMDKLLERGMDIDSVDKDGYTALHKAVVGKKEAVISHLLRKGANPHVKDRDGATALHHAVQVGAMLTVKLLIKYKVDVNVADKDGWTPLHVAMQTRSRDIAKVLLVNGADKTRRNKDGKTPLDLSLCYGKNFKSYELAKLVKLVPAKNRDL